MWIWIYFCLFECEMSFWLWVVVSGFGYLIFDPPAQFYFRVDLSWWSQRRHFIRCIAKYITVPLASMIIHTPREWGRAATEKHIRAHRCCAFEGLWPVYIGRRANRITADKRIHQIILKILCRSGWVYKRRRLTSSHGGRAPERKKRSVGRCASVQTCWALPAAAHQLFVSML